MSLTRLATSLLARQNDIVCPGNEQADEGNGKTRAMEDSETTITPTQ
jgi:hypothetical protein